ncbi:hypothetical protein [Candidatus Nitrosocosmicus sp. R]
MNVGSHGIIVNDEQNYSQWKLTKSDSQVNVDIFSTQKNHHIMKDFKDMTLEEKEEILERIKNLPENKKEDGCDCFDLFSQSFDEISKNWFDSLKEFDTLYPDYLKDEDTNPLEKYEFRWTAKIRKKLF